MRPHPSLPRLLIPCLAAATAILATGCGRAAAPPPPAARPVTAVTVEPERLVLTAELPGRIAPRLVAEVRPQVNGIVQQRLFEEGTDVRAGDLLYQIDPAPYQAALDQVEAALAVAEAAVPAARSRSERMRQLVAIRAVGEQDADDAAAALLRAEAGVAAARAAVESARIQLSYTPIRAPISGRSGRSSVTVGALVTAYQPVPLVVVQQLDPVFVDVQQSSAELLRLRKVLASGALTRGGEASERVRLLLEDGSLYPLAGTLAFQDVTVAPTTGTVTLRLIFPNPDHLLLPGMFVRAVVEEGIDEAAILVPQQGVSRDPRGNAIALVVGEDGTAAVRPLTLERAIGDRWRVLEGLAAGDRVIVDGLQGLRPGMPVAVAPDQPAGAAPPASAGG